jgi:hypothetical protein
LCSSMVHGGGKRRRSAIHVLPVHSRTASKITKAPRITRANTNSKNGEKLVISGMPPARPSFGAPIFFRLTPHGGCDRILDLEPVIDAARTVRRTEAFRDNAFAAEGAGVLEDDRAFAVEMPVEGDTVIRGAEEIG